MLPPASKNVATGGPFGSNGKLSVGGSSWMPPLPAPNVALVSPPATASPPPPSALPLSTTARSPALSLSSTTTAASGRTAVGAHPGARKVWLAVSRARRRRRHDHIALGMARDACFPGRG